MELNDGKLDKNTTISSLTIRELRRGLQLMDQLCLLVEDGSSEVARELCQQVVEAIEASLLYLNSMDIINNLERCTCEETKSSTSHVDSQSQVHRRRRRASDEGFRPSGSEDLNPRSQIRRKVSSESTVTPYPFNDGYQWRKYGQKEIHNHIHPRCYYRCTYKNCNAKKQVQQKNSTYPPLYEVILNNDHTCNAICRLPFPELMSASSSEGTQMIRFDSFISNVRSFKSKVLSPLSSTDTFTSSSPEINNVFAASAQIVDLISPPSPPGQFYGSDASAYNGLEEENFNQFFRTDHFNL